MICDFLKISPCLSFHFDLLMSSEGRVFVMHSTGWRYFSSRFPFFVFAGFLSWCLLHCSSSILGGVHGAIMYYHYYLFLSTVADSRNRLCYSRFTLEPRSPRGSLYIHWISASKLVANMFHEIQPCPSTVHSMCSVHTMVPTNLVELTIHRKCTVCKY